MMNPKTEKIIRKKISEFDNWTDTKYSFLTMSMNTGDYSNDEQAFIWTDTDLMYSQIFETFLEIDNFRDGWTKEMSMPLAVDRGLAVYYRAEKTETLYHFGTDELGFFLSTDLFHMQKSARHHTSTENRRVFCIHLSSIHLPWNGTTAPTKTWDP